MPYGSEAYGTAPYGGEDAPSSSPPPPPDAPVLTAVRPTLVVEVAFTTAPFAVSPVWVDVSRYVRLGSTRRGRSSELDRVTAGTLNLTLDNRTRRFDPANTAGPYYGNLLPNRKIRVRATASGVTYGLFQGFVDNWEQVHDVGGDAVCAIQATDGFKRLAQKRLPPAESAPDVPNPSAFVRGVESSGARVAALLTHAGWPAWERDIDTGAAVCAAKTYDGQSVLDALLEVDTTEQSRMHVSNDGRFVFHDRNALITDTVYTDPQISFADDQDGADVPYANISFDHSDRLIRNEVVVTNEVFGTFTKSDAASIDAYGPQSYSIGVIDASSQASNSTAENLLALYKDAKSRVTGLKVKPHRATAGWPDGMYPPVFNMDLGFRSNLRRQPVGGGPEIDEDYFIDQISHSFRPDWWEVDFGLGLAMPSEGYWLWGTGTWGTQKWAW